ncbi:hypothetical protein G7K71_14355 [Desulfofundulus sp. TPOSR]|uniref:hypothetical protein n=1 Tax=Desulfofundulus sp. TPOSR TaxID=2714340 RepID=UPI00140DA5E2|nr:hypothetical protein [Desulfofundulus sp. TPOSR]NHM28140.1 hypothetical protein [Desulfofundulus sp. TPOSR]
MRLGLYRLTDDRGFVIPVALVIAIGLLFAGLAAVLLSAQASKMAAGDRMLAQARCAADTGIERVKVFLMADPMWSNGSVAEGPVDESSEVEEVTIEHTAQGGKQMAVVTSTGRCGKIRKTVRAVIETGLVPLVAAYGGGIKQLKQYPLEFSGSSLVKSDVLVNGSLGVQGSAAIGLSGEKRTVYADGSIYVQKVKSIQGDAYATGYVHPLAATGKAVANWEPPVAFPDIGDLNSLIGLARSIAQATEQATGKQHYFPSSKTFTSSELANLEGIYFVEGDAYIPGGATNARASIVTADDIFVTGSLLAEKLVFMAADDIVLKNASGTSVALAAAGGDAGWGNTGGGNAYWSLKYGALVAGTVNGGDVRGDVTLEQNDKVDFGALAAPVHTAKVVSRSEV